MASFRSTSKMLLRSPSTHFGTVRVGIPELGMSVSLQHGGEEVKGNRVVGGMEWQADLRLRQACVADDDIPVAELSRDMAPRDDDRFAEEPPWFGEFQSCSRRHNSADGNLLASDNALPEAIHG